MMRRSSIRRRRGGFTLIEAMIAMGVLTFGILGVAALQNSALSRESKSRFSSDAAQLAKNQIEAIRRLPWSTIVETGGGGTDFELLCTTASAGGACSFGGSGGVSGYPNAQPTTLPEIPLTQVAADGSTRVLTTYLLAWRIQDVGASSARQCQKNVTIRVEWQDGGNITREHYLSTRVFNNLGDRGATSADLGIVNLSDGC